ncbi:MAG: rhodanese-like domain-containing protein [Synechococcaceae cyanobacterium]|nr:rhodanese-like domain-containing protein [Synechococcaceae cyanobacterium]
MVIHDPEFLQRAAEAKARVDQLHPGDLDAALEAGAILIDVREPAELAQGTIPGSLNIPLDSLPKRIAAVVPDLSAAIVCFCRGGNRGSLAAADLLDLGYTNVRSIAGGLEGLAAGEPAP